MISEVIFDAGHFMPVADDGFDVFVARHQAAVWRFAARRVGVDDADDIVSEAMTVAWRRRTSIESPTERAWLYGVARRTIGNRLRQRRRIDRLRRKVAALPATSTSFPFPDHGPPGDLLADVWVELSSEHREVLLLVAWEQLSTPEIAATFGISEAAARKRLSRARASARKIAGRISSDQEAELVRRS